jgi:hypothetical protein
MALAKKQKPIQAVFSQGITCVMDKMGFRKQTTYNINDTNYIKGGRHIIVNGVRQRCELVLRALLRAKRTTSKHLYDYQIQSVLNKRFHNDSYSLTDIQYVLTRLQSADLVEENEKGAFTSVSGALTTFYKLSSN